MQADLHSVWSHGASCSRCVRHTEFSEAPAHAGGYLRRSHPTFTRGANLSSSASEKTYVATPTHPHDRGEKPSHSRPCRLPTSSVAEPSGRAVDLGLGEPEKCEDPETDDEIEECCGRSKQVGGQMGDAMGDDVSGLS